MDSLNFDLFNAPVIDMSHVPDGKAGNWEVQSYAVTAEEAARFNGISNIAMRNITAGSYKRLIVYDMAGNADTMMSNTPAEIADFLTWAEAVEGDVLINGLGLGVLVTYLLTRPKVRSITVIENSPYVIKLVAPYLQNDRLRIIQADAFKWHPEPGDRNYWDFVWHDIWLAISSENLPQMRRLMKKYDGRCRAQECWCMDICLEKRQEEGKLLLLVRAIKQGKIPKQDGHALLQLSLMAKMQKEGTIVYFT